MRINHIMASESSSTSLADLERIIKDTEYANSKLVGQIDEEIQVSRDLDNKIGEQNSAVAKLETEITSLDQETAVLHKQYEDNKETAMSLRKSTNIMDSHLEQLRRKLADVKEVSREKTAKHEAYLEKYRLKWLEYKAKWESKPLAIELAALKQQASDLNAQVEAAVEKLNQLTLKKSQRQKTTASDKEKKKTMVDLIVEMANYRRNTNEMVKEIEEIHKVLKLKKEEKRAAADQMFQIGQERQQDELMSVSDTMPSRDEGIIAAMERGKDSTATNNSRFQMSSSSNSFVDSANNLHFPGSSINTCSINTSSINTSSIASSQSFQISSRGDNFIEGALLNSSNNNSNTGTEKRNSVTGKSSTQELLQPTGVEGTSAKDFQLQNQIHQDVLYLHPRASKNPPKEQAHLASSDQRSIALSPSKLPVKRKPAVFQPREPSFSLQEPNQPQRAQVNTSQVNTSLRSSTLPKAPQQPQTSKYAMTSKYTQLQMPTAPKFKLKELSPLKPSFAERKIPQLSIPQRPPTQRPQPSMLNILEKPKRFQPMTNTPSLKLAKEKAPDDMNLSIKTVQQENPPKTKSDSELMSPPSSLPITAVAKQRRVSPLKGKGPSASPPQKGAAMEQREPHENVAGDDQAMDHSEMDYQERQVEDGNNTLYTDQAYTQMESQNIEYEAEMPDPDSMIDGEAGTLYRFSPGQHAEQLKKLTKSPGEGFQMDSRLMFSQSDAQREERPPGDGDPPGNYSFASSTNSLFSNPFITTGNSIFGFGNANPSPDTNSKEGQISQNNDGQTLQNNDQEMGNSFWPNNGEEKTPKQGGGCSLFGSPAGSPGQKMDSSSFSFGFSSKNSAQSSGGFSFF